jgi:hypothetical protein
MIKATVRGWYWNGNLTGFKWKCGDAECSKRGGRGYSKRTIGCLYWGELDDSLKRAVTGAYRHICKYHREPAQ